MNRSSRILGFGVTALALAGSAACSSYSKSATSSRSSVAASATAAMPSLPSGAANAPAASAADTITIRNFAFGGPLTVAPGTSITVLNRDDVQHTVTADSAGGFDVSVPPGGSATFAAPNAPGTYAFHCSIHPHMKHGSLIVK